MATTTSTNVVAFAKVRFMVRSLQYVQTNVRISCAAVGKSEVELLESNASGRDYPLGLPLQREANSTEELRQTRWRMCMKRRSYRGDGDPGRERQEEGYQQRL